MLHINPINRDGITKRLKGNPLQIQLLNITYNVI